jgi:carbon monoxide dehydrogenase subunit G
MKMNLGGMERINRELAAVHSFVTDPNRVGRCMPDLQELKVEDEHHMLALVRVGIGPIKGTFKMEVELLPSTEADEAAMRLKGSGMGNGLTLASSMRMVSPEAGVTELHWTAEATVSGPLAGVGGRLLEGQAKKTTEQLFTNIREALEGQQAPV